ncbi:hypothetical protein Tco_1426310, partial [Tanacetum coccineum]
PPPDPYSTATQFGGVTNCILMANLEQASTSVTYADKTTVYDSNGSAKYDNNVIPTDSSMDSGGGEVEQLPATIEKMRALYESLYNNLVIEVEKVNTVNHETKEANVKLTAELTRYRGREKSFEFNQAKFEELENGVERATRSRRPQPRSATKNDRVPSASKSSCIKNNKVSRRTP